MERSVYDTMRRIEGSHWWFRARRQILADQIGRLDLPPQARILEVGCGVGGNLEMLADFGAVTGIEPDAPSRAYAAERSGRPVLNGALPHGLPPFEAPFDMIAALDVIEHLDEDGASLATLRGALSPGGWLVTTVPAHPWLWSRHDELHHHKRRYRRDDYLALIRGAGFTIEKASYFNAALFPPIALARALKLSERAGGSDDSLPPAPVNTLLKAIFATERFPLRAFNLPFGVSLLVIARRAPAPH